MQIWWPGRLIYILTCVDPRIVKNIKCQAYKYVYTLDSGLDVIYVTRYDCNYKVYMMFLYEISTKVLPTNNVR
jgi:hypothetical protein